MELVFHEQTLRYLSEKRYDLIYQEQTAEMTIPETLPAVGRIVDCFGTVTVQSQTVETGGVSVSGTIQAGVLYVPESGEGIEKIDVVLPFTVTKKLPTQDDTQLFYWGWLRQIDARTINSRKVLVRSSLGSELTLLTPAELRICKPVDPPATMQWKEETVKLRLPLCAAEKEIVLADEVPLGETSPGIARLLKWTCLPGISETNLIGNKAVFKGELRLHCLYETESGAIAGWNGSVPFSQYAELDRELPEGFVSVQPILRHAELETDGQMAAQRLLLNMTVTAQITVRGEVTVPCILDGYDLVGVFSPQWRTLEAETGAEANRMQRILTVPLPPEAVSVLDWTLFPDKPGPEAGQNAGIVGNLLYVDAAQGICGKQFREQLSIPAPAEAGEQHWKLTVDPAGGVQGRSLQLPIWAETETISRVTMQSICGGAVEQTACSAGPSLLITRGEGPLWEIAKRCRTTVRALKTVNRLEKDVLERPCRILVPMGAVQNAEEEQS